MDVASVRIFVTDLPAAAKFYAEVVGLEQVWSSPEAVVFGKEPMVVVEAADAEAHAEGLVGRFTGVAFATDDATVLYRELTRAGVATHGPPERQPWGGILVHAKDPSGNTITFLQSPAKGSAAKGSDP